MSNRLSWIMGTLAAGAALTAVGVGLNGMRTAPVTKQPRNASAAGSVSPDEGDPLAPKLFDKSGTIRVHVAGAVRKPGVYSLQEWARVVDAMKRAGGPTSQADLDAINLADPVKDGEQVRIPTRGRAERLSSHFPTPEPGRIDSTAGGTRSGRYPFTVQPSRYGAQSMSVRGAAATVPTQVASGAVPVNLNSADKDDLEALPGVGPATADAILAYRVRSGPFVAPEDLLNVRGIGPKKFDQLRPLVTAP